MGSIIIWITMSIAFPASLTHSFSTQDDESDPESKYSFLVSQPPSAYVPPSYAIPSFYYPVAAESYNQPSAASSPTQETLSSSHLLPSPSIQTAASIPFVFGRKGKDKRASIVRGKPVYGNKPSTPSQAASQENVDWSSYDMLQHPIDEAPRKTDRSLGQPCSYSTDCGSGCCLLDRTTKIRSCQAMANVSQKCTKYQAKGDLYVDACPCASGVDYCNISNNRCTR